MQGPAGEDQPLPDHPGAAFINPDHATGFRIKAEAGVLPDEITLKNSRPAQRAHPAAQTDQADRKAAMAVLSRIKMRQAISEDPQREFLKG